MPKYTKTLLTLAVLTGLSLVSDSLIPQAYAATAPVSPTKDALASGELTQNILTALNVMAWTAFTLLQDLLDPQNIFNTGSLIEGTVNKVWVLSRDIVNIMFAVTLALAAIYTVIKADAQMIKDNLGKFAIAVVLVNFSWLLPLMILDTANILTGVVYGLPKQAGGSEGFQCTLPPGKKEDGTDATKKEDCKIVSKVELFPNEKRRKVLAGDGKGSTGQGFDCTLQFVCYKTEAWNNAPTEERGKGAYNNILQGLVFNYARLGDMARLPKIDAPKDTSENVELWIKYMIRQLIVIVMHIALAFPLMAMVVAMIMRLPILWGTMAFMPFWFLGWALQGFNVPGAEKTKGILDEFIKAAMLPVTTAVPLTIGFMMMGAVSAAGWTPIGTALTKDAPMTFAGAITSYSQLLWMIMALAVLWKGTFMALSEGGIAGSAGGFFKSIGESVGKMGLMAPLMLPLPVGLKNGKGESMSILGNLRALDPRNLAAGMSGSSDFGSFMENIRGGTRGGQTLLEEKKVQSADKSALRNDLVKAKTDLETLNKDSSKKPEDKKAFVEALARKMAEKLGTKINGGNLVDALKALKDRKDIRSDSNLTSSINDLIREMETPSAPPVAPATPPTPAPSPGTPPAAPPTTPAP